MRQIKLILLAAMMALALLPSAAAAAAATYTVQAGDTLTSIAARYDTTVAAISAANSLGSTMIIVGQTLSIPAGTTQSAPTTQTGNTEGGTYVVVAGDTLYGIALRFDTSVDAIMAANGLTDRGLIYAGQRLTIPGGTVSAPAAEPTSAPAQPTATSGSVPAEGTTYTVQPGDYLAAIANRFGVTVDALVAANNLSDPNTIHSGLVLTIPGANSAPAATATAVPPTNTPAPPAATHTALPNMPDDAPDEGAIPETPAAGSEVEYVVQAGDRLYSIASTYGTTVDAIVAKNGLSNPNMIYPGQKLKVVVGDMTSKPAVDDPNEPAKATGSEDNVPTTTGRTGKWIDVNVSTQRLVAYEGDTPVYWAVVSTGTYLTPTVIGEFKVYAKYRYDDMTGGTGADYYYLPNVPHTMYFYGGYAIHGTYWHTNFGTPMSHGCVNLNPTDAEWIYNWTPVGTIVYTHW